MVFWCVCTQERTTKPERLANLSSTKCYILAWSKQPRPTVTPRLLTPVLSPMI